MHAVHARSGAIAGLAATVRDTRIRGANARTGVTGRIAAIVASGARGAGAATAGEAASSRAASRGATPRALRPRDR